MRYTDLVSFNPIQSVIQIGEAEETKQAKRLVETFVITPRLGESIKHVVLPQMDLNEQVEGKGIFVVGNYGTGKSHFMGFLSILAENEGLLQSVREQNWRERLRPIAGKYKVNRADLGASGMPFYRVVCTLLMEVAEDCGFSFSFKSYEDVIDAKKEFRRFMTEFEKNQPEKGVLLVIDEVLEYLKGMEEEHDRVTNLGILRKLAEFCNGSRMSIMLGIQQALYEVPEFQYISEDVDHVHARFEDVRIGKEGVEQLIEQYLFKKNEAQKETIRELLRGQADLYPTIEKRIERFAAVFPAHPRFIDDFQSLSVVERRELLTVLSQEGYKLFGEHIDEENPELITPDDYWRRIEDNPSLDTNPNVRKVKGNVSTLKARVEDELDDQEDKEAAHSLIEALGVHRLTTPSIEDQVGLTPASLRDGLLWRTDIPMRDSDMLGEAAKRLLKKTREAANGQFLAVDTQSGQWYIDPSRDKDYALEVQKRASTINRSAVQRALNNIVALTLEIDGRGVHNRSKLWRYELIWKDKNVGRPGWLFFGFPNQRSTAQPPLDFYLFLIPSKRIVNQEEEIPGREDEMYFFFEDFPSWKQDPNSPSADTDPDTFLDTVAEYAAAKKLAQRHPDAPYTKIAKRREQTLLDDFRKHGPEWITVRYQETERTLATWISDLAPEKSNSLLRSQIDTVAQECLSRHFEDKYPGYPQFDRTVTEDTRSDSVRAAMEIVCGIGLGGAQSGTELGEAVLRGLNLYDGDKLTPEASPWLTEVRDRLDALGPNEFLNFSDLFERRGGSDGRLWMNGRRIEADFLLLCLSTGVRAGYLVIVGQGNKRYDASNLRQLYRQVKTPDDVVRVGQPREIPLEEWRALFGLFERLNAGLLANQKTRGEAARKFHSRVAEEIGLLARVERGLRSSHAFLTNHGVPGQRKQEVQEKLDEHADSVSEAKERLETLKTLNTEAKMRNLRLSTDEIESLGGRLELARASLDVLRLLSDMEDEMELLERHEEFADDEQLVEDLSALRESLYSALKNPVQERDGLEDLRRRVEQAATDAFKSYEEKRRFHRLGEDAHQRKKKLIESRELEHLNRLSRLDALEAGKGRLESVQQALRDLKVFRSGSKRDLLQSSDSLCPFDHFDPRETTGNLSAEDRLDYCIERVNSMHEKWESQLLEEIEDPTVQDSIENLKPEKRQSVEEFAERGSLPDEIDDVFLNALNEALSGLEREIIHPDSLATSILEPGLPLRPKEVRRRFSEWLASVTDGKNADDIRLVLEDTPGSTGPT